MDCCTLPPLGAPGLPRLCCLCMYLNVYTLHLLDVPVHADGDAELYCMYFSPASQVRGVCVCLMGVAMCDVREEMPILFNWDLAGIPIHTHTRALSNSGVTHTRYRMDVIAHWDGVLVSLLYQFSSPPLTKKRSRVVCTTVLRTHRSSTYSDSVSVSVCLCHPQSNPTNQPFTTDKTWDSACTVCTAHNGPVQFSHYYPTAVNSCSQLQ